MRRDYEKRTNRIQAWGHLFDVFGRNLIRLVWVLVILIVAAAVGKILIFNSETTDVGAISSKAPVSKPIVQPIQWNAVDEAIVAAANVARASAEQYASEKLDGIVAGWTQRIDDDFLPWYFSYWNQQKIGLQGIYHSVRHWVDETNPSAATAMMETIQEEFATRVLRPQITQLELEKITRDTVDLYIAVLRDEIETIPGRFDIPKEEWDRYLEDIAVMTSTVEGNRQVDLSLKALTGTTVAGSVVIAKAIAKITGKIGTKVSANVAGKAAAVAAAKTGGKVAAKMGGKLLGPIIGVGIIIWDLWDHQSTKEHSQPILRQNLLDYLQEVKTVLLTDPESGIMATIYHIEENIVSSLEKSSG